MRFDVRPQPFMGLTTVNDRKAEFCILLGARVKTAGTVECCPEALGNPM
jgi:hypothetical protein